MSQHQDTLRGALAAASPATDLAAVCNLHSASYYFNHCLPNLPPYHYSSAVDIVGRHSPPASYLPVRKEVNWNAVTSVNRAEPGSHITTTDDNDDHDTELDELGISRPVSHPIDEHTLLSTYT